MFEINDVLQLQYTGEVNNIRTIQSQVHVLGLTIAFILTIKVDYKKNLYIHKYT